MAAFYVIRSKNYEDVHKSIKYGVWTSSKYNNKRFADAITQKKTIYFLFTVMNSNKFVGIAKVVEGPFMNAEFPYWGEIGKWIGVIRVEWLCIRDLFFDNVTHIKYEDQCAYDWKDGFDLPTDVGYLLAKMISKVEQQGVILKYFNKYDNSEKETRSKLETIIENNMLSMFKEKNKKDKEIMKNI